MLNVSIPHDFDEIKSDILLIINQDRKLINIELIHKHIYIFLI